MNRLTRQEYIDDPTSIKSVYLPSYTSIYWKLAEYEKTGLTPEEIIINEELFKAYRHVCGGKSPEEIKNIESERDYWRGEAIKATAELGEIKIAEEQGLLYICEKICPCNQCNTEPEQCELAKAYIKLQEVKQDVLNLTTTLDNA